MKQELLDYINQVEEPTKDDWDIIHKRLVGCFAFCDTLQDVKTIIEHIFNVPVVAIKKQEDSFKLVVEGHLLRTKLSAFGELLEYFKQTRNDETQGIKGVPLTTLFISLEDINKLKPILYTDETVKTGHLLERFQ